jgi:uncharacterized protein YegL
MNDFIGQVPFAGEFADNPEPRCPCVLLLDTSGSMGGDPITELNAGLQTFKDELVADSLAGKRAEVSVITFGPVQVIAEFQTADVFQPPHLTASGQTPMGEAITLALAKVRERKDVYKANGISYYRPWVFLITDGAPTDAWQEAARQVRSGEEGKAFMFFAVGVQGANMDILKQISVRDPLTLKGLRFRDLFSWLSASLKGVSHSQTTDAPPLQNPVTPQGWANAG